MQANCTNLQFPAKRLSSSRHSLKLPSEGGFQYRFLQLLQIRQLLSINPLQFLHLPYFARSQFLEIVDE